MSGTYECSLNETAVAPPGLHEARRPTQRLRAGLLHFAPPGLSLLRSREPWSYALGYYISPLRGFRYCALENLGLTRWAITFRPSGAFVTALLRLAPGGAFATGTLATVQAGDSTCRRRRGSV